MRKRKKLKKEVKIFNAIFLLTIILFIIIKIKSNNENNIEERSKSYNEYITDNIESNTDLKITFAGGMDINEYKKLIDKEPSYISSNNKYTKVNYNFEKQYKYSELEKLYKELNKSEIVKLEVIGKTIDNRNIYSIEIGKGTNETLMSGNIHAAEIAPALYLTKYAVDLVNKYESNDKETVKLLTNNKIVIIPSVNPDGYDYSIFGKKLISNKDNYVINNDLEIDNNYIKSNLNGVDINRNFPSQTGGLYFNNKELYSTVSYKRSTKMYQYFAGDSLGSEPETKAVIYWMLNHYKNTHALISLHSAGRVIYNGRDDLTEEYNNLAHKCAKVLSDTTGYIYEGIGDVYGNGSNGNETDFIIELAHGYKMSTKTGRLSTDSYHSTNMKLKYKLCVTTLEVLENYTDDLSLIKEEYETKHIEKAMNEIVKLSLNS